MFKPFFSTSLVVLSVLLAIPSCAPDLQVGSQSSSGSMGGTGGMDVSSSSSSSGMVSSSSSSGNSSSSSGASSGSGGASGMLGTPCALNEHCGSGFCADGVCCNKPCDTGCMNCAQAGTEGECLPVAIGVDDCAVEGFLCDADGVCGCGISKDPSMSACPAGWTAGPNSGSCVWSCDTPGSCGADKIVCPPGFDCIVNCSGDGSCSGLNAEVECPLDHECTVNCNGPSSCQDGFRTRCSETGPCTMACGTTMSPCLGGEIKCGSNGCRAICAGSSKPTMDEGNSCGAQGC